MFKPSLRARWRSGVQPPRDQKSGDAGDAPLVQLTYAAPWVTAIPASERQGVGWGPPDAYGDDEFGRATELRAALRQRGWRYVLDVPCDTLVRDIDEPPAAGKRCPPWRRADAWAEGLPASRWRRVRVGDGTQGPKEVRLAEAWVQTKDSGGRVGALERLVVLRTIDREPRTWYTLSNAPRRVEGEQLAQVHGRRHGVEEALQAGKGEVGLAHYEVRGWVGWHHHMTLSLLALWFLAQEKQRLGGKNPGPDGAAVARSVRAAAPTAAAECPGDRVGR